MSTQIPSSGWCTPNLFAVIVGDNNTENCPGPNGSTLPGRLYLSPLSTRVDSVNDLLVWNREGQPPCLNARLALSCHLCSTVSCGIRLKPVFTETTFFFFNWSIVDLQYCVNFCYTVKLISVIHTYTFFIFFSIMVYHRILNIVPCAIQQNLVVYRFYI